jgi:hypothetical protein
MPANVRRLRRPAIDETPETPWNIRVSIDAAARGVSERERMTDRHPSRDVHVGGAILRVDGEADTTMRPAAGPEEAERARLADALGDLAGEPSALEHAERLRDTADATTARVEEVKAALELLVQGADLGQVVEQLDGWLGEVRRRYAGGDFEGVIRFVRVLTGVLVLARRWRDLVAALSLAVAAAQRVGDMAAEAWALCELGSLALVAGDEPLATQLLGLAADRFERAGDHGAAQEASARLHRHLAPPSRRLRSVARRKLAAGAVVAVAGLALVLPPERGPDAEIVAFATTSSQHAPGGFDERRGREVPATAVKPGGVLHACDPLYLVAYVRYSDMSRATRVIAEARVAGAFAARSVSRWTLPTEFTTAERAFHRSAGGPAVSSGRPVPAGRWRYAVRLDGEVRDTESVTLRRSCP